jgi:hypothetical protein
MSPTADFRTVDHVNIEDGSLCEVKTAGIASRRKGRPRFGHLIAILLFAIAAFLNPMLILGTVALVTGCLVALVVFVYVVQLPIRLLASRLPTKRPVRESRKART